MSAGADLGDCLRGISGTRTLAVTLGGIRTRTENVSLCRCQLLVISRRTERYSPLAALSDPPECGRGSSRPKPTVPGAWSMPSRYRQIHSVTEPSA